MSQDDIQSAPAPATVAAAPEPAPWTQLEHRSNFFTRGMILDTCVRLAMRVPGNIVEFGVADGSSTRVIIRALRRYGRFGFRPHPRKEVFALDSFEGLREAYENAPVGAFAQPVPKIPGAVIVKGYFEDTCTTALRQRVGRVAFAHLDADLYSSTHFALEWLTPMLGTGSLLLFDEFKGGDRAEERAFEDWRGNCGLQLLKVAEFTREPSGWGHTLDMRALYQVVGPEAMDRSGEAQAWKWAWRAKRLGLGTLESWIKNAF